MAMASVGRKRTRSHEVSTLSVQNKKFINQKLIDQQDHVQMKQIYGLAPKTFTLASNPTTICLIALYFIFPDKTFDLLFKGAKLASNSTENNNNNPELSKNNHLFNVRLSGNGNLKFATKQKPIGFPEISKLSKCCKKSAFVSSDCINCNLNLCEFCACSCSGGCGKFLCVTCITIFDCGSAEEPICQNCKFLS